MAGVERQHATMVSAHAEPRLADGDGHALRCRCNRLVCVIEGDDVVIKCGRCKRMIRIRTRGVVETVYDEA